MSRIVHFSVDDVLPSLKYLTEHEAEINSIYEMNFYNTLLHFHEKYGIRVTLYLFDMARDFKITDVSIKYKNDFKDVADWLKFGFHGRDTNKSFYNSPNNKEFIEAYNNVEQFSKLMQGRSLSEICRLHYFEADNSRINFLKEKGIKTLLTADDDRNSYGLSQNICNEIRKKHEIVLDGMKYVNTDYRIENIENVDNILLEMKEKKNIILFTHEWCFMKNIHIMDNIFKELKKRDYVYFNR